ncbi:hypothetical protein ACVIIV_006783 [Bradyrhizobium sp. USDA 4354]
MIAPLSLEMTAASAGSCGLGRFAAQRHLCGRRIAGHLA